tara:strand:+ start:812 stop:1708 length:897 start_codon:yes stop_codon:yes gene_type:complete
MTNSKTQHLQLPPERKKKLEISFEFFPPKTQKMEQTLWRAIQRLKILTPVFVSVTYGAGGTTRERTHNTVLRIKNDTNLKPAAHLTCVKATRDEVDQIARTYWNSGIKHIVALRGDVDNGQGRYTPHPEGYPYASDLIKGLKNIGDFEISVAAYPEGHPDSPSFQHDLDNLKRKIDAGADRAITQYFFETKTYLRFLEKVRAAGINLPIVPGILPVTNFAQIAKFSASCGCNVPIWMADLFAGLDQDPETRNLVAASVAIDQCRQLQNAGIDQFHIYTLNRADLAYSISHILGLRPLQ